MPKQISDLLKSGEKARLFPVVSEKSIERRATSIFLSTLSVVEEFSKAVLLSIGQRIGKRADIQCFTEVVLPSKLNESNRPDGLIVITIGKRTWSALVEAKTGNAVLDEGQVNRYLALAKEHNIDAVITISNQFATMPTHHPLKLTKSATKNVDLYHWSWTYLLTEAVLQMNVEQNIDPEQLYILDEFNRFLSHPSSGVKSFDSMNKEWKEVCIKVKQNERLLKTSDATRNTIGAWHQELRDISLLLTRELNSPVSIKLAKSHKGDPEKKFRDDCEQLVNNQILQSSFEIPDAASAINIQADLARRTVCCSMELQAPGDKKSTKAKVNWLLRQISDTDLKDIQISAKWPGRAQDTFESLETLRDDPLAIQTENTSLVPSKFQISSIRDMAGKFSGSKSFLQGLNEQVPLFYKEVGEQLRAWVPSPPKLRDDPLAVDPDNISGL